MKVLVTAIALLASSLAAQDPEPAPNPFKPFDRARFVEHAKSLGADETQIAAYETACGEDSTAHATESLLRELVPSLDAAITLAEDGEPRAALELAAMIDGNEDEFVRGFARYHLGRHMLDADDPDKSAEVFAQYLRHDKNTIPLDAEVAFFYGTSLAEVPRPLDAAATFADFLELFPDAPERYRAVAAQRKAELEAQFESPLHEIADSMKGVSRDLRRAETGKPTQKKQEDLVDKLQKIIEELEQQEQQTGAASGNSRSNNPAASSSLPGGASRTGSLHDAPRVAERWGNMKDLERKAIEADVQARLSGPMKKLVEEYYKKLNEGPDR